MGGDQVWYRGEAEGGSVSKPGGGAIHDLGDGVYYTSDREVAKTYADTRAADLGGRQFARAYQVSIDVSRLRVLDLTKDLRWNTYLQSRPAGSLTVEQMIRLANENYGRFFESFLAQNKIDLRSYDAVIGPEFVRGNNQLCVLLKNGKQTDLHRTIRAGSTLYYSGGREVEVPPMGPTPVGFAPATQEILRMNSPVRRAAGVQAAAAAAGVALGEAIQWLGDVGIARRVRQEIETTNARAIENIFARGEGVLVIVRLEEWGTPDDLGRRARGLLSVSVQGGKTEQTALTAWQTQPKLLAGPAPGWRSFEKYAWLPPAQ
jgi:hypothetical protein